MLLLLSLLLLLLLLLGCGHLRLELRLHRLTGLGRDEIGNEAKGLAEKIADFLDILRSRPRILDIIRGELSEVREKFAVPRRSEFVFGDADMDDEDGQVVEPNPNANPEPNTWTMRMGGRSSGSSAPFHLAPSQPSRS